jgi:aminoglycoside phosphotransferase (APT) family kinase protein
VDWEWAHGGDPIEDLAWCEWIVRAHHPHQADALDGFFEAYGDRPHWPDRQRAMLTRQRALITFAEGWDPDGAAAELWRRRHSETETWTK